MIEHHFHHSQHWECWLVLLRRWEGSEAELSARTLLLRERLEQEGGTDGDVLLRAMDLADRAMQAAIQPDVQPAQATPSSAWGSPLRIAAAAAVLVAAGAGYWTRAATEEPAPQYRGAPEARVQASVWFTVDGVPLGSVQLGSGIRPSLAATGPAHVQAHGGENTCMWQVGAGHVDCGTEWQIQPREGQTWAVAEVHPSMSAEVVAELLGDGRTLVDGLGPVDVVFVDWTAP